MNRVIAALPPELQGAIEFLTVPETRKSWGGPFNGQLRRASQVREIFEAIKPDAVFETGTYRATSTIALAALSDAPLYTMEQSAKQWGYSRTRLLLHRGVTLLRGDSRVHLKRLCEQLHRTTKAPFFYLDAHWEEDLPLAQELEIIFAFPWQATVMVDDFKVEGDTGYAFDDYGPGKVLDLGYVKHTVERHALEVFFPSAPSAEETGAKRGCLVLARKGEVADKLDLLASMRRHKVEAA
ncbi:MAG: hypothetical protein V4669_05605 [Pseudomonadota bacterium]